MARRPLIQPGSVLPAAPDTTRGEGGVLGRIIANDREKNGRATLPTPPAQEGPENVTTLQPSNEGVLVSTLDGSNAATQERGSVGSNDTRNAETSVSNNESPEDAGLDARMALALDRAGEDEVAVVTVRAPQRLNAYIDRYVERVNRVSPRRKYRKQDAVAEMFAWFYASHPMPPAPEEDDL